MLGTGVGQATELRGQVSGGGGEWGWGVRGGWVETRNNPATSHNTVFIHCLIPFLILPFSDLRSKVSFLEPIVLSFIAIGNVIIYLFAFLFTFL